jgi:hypothetical protein
MVESVTANDFVDVGAGTIDIEADLDVDFDTAHHLTSPARMGIVHNDAEVRQPVV